MFFFSKKKKITLTKLADYILRINSQIIYQFMENEMKDEESIFNRLDEDDVRFELFLVSLWSLNYLDCGIEIFNAVLRYYTNESGMPEKHKDEFMLTLESRFKNYFELIPEDSNSLYFFCSEVLKNMNNGKLLNDIGATTFIAEFFTSITGTNSKIISDARKKFNIIL